MFTPNHEMSDSLLLFGLIDTDSSTPAMDYCTSLFLPILYGLWLERICSQSSLCNKNLLFDFAVACTV